MNTCLKLCTVCAPWFHRYSYLLTFGDSNFHFNGIILFIKWKIIYSAFCNPIYIKDQRYFFLSIQEMTTIKRTSQTSFFHPPQKKFQNASVSLVEFFPYFHWLYFPFIIIQSVAAKRVTYMNLDHPMLSFFKSAVFVYLNHTLLLAEGWNSTLVYVVFHSLIYLIFR